MPPAVSGMQGVSNMRAQRVPLWGNETFRKQLVLVPSSDTDVYNLVAANLRCYEI
jgi:hypothetical protein